MDVIHQASVRTSTYLEDGGVDFRRVKQKAERNLRFWWQWGNILYLKTSYATTLLSNWSWTFFNNSLLSLLCVCVWCAFMEAKRQFGDVSSSPHLYIGSRDRRHVVRLSYTHCTILPTQKFNHEIFIRSGYVWVVACVQVYLQACTSEGQSITSGFVAQVLSIFLFETFLLLLA